jgi:two-component system phosphate regulon response regulator PhoB/two-component system alkaline phosphatase synthesis response regulator PhoP
MSQLIYIVDDEPDLLELVELNLSRAGFLTDTFERAEPMVRALAKKLPDLLILDLMLPDADGMELCKKLRAQTDFARLPIVMLTARVTIEDKLMGLDFGADDYLTKPFEPKELVARVKAVLRRAEWITANNVLSIPDAEIDQIPHAVSSVFYGLKIDMNRFEVFVDDKKCDLTQTEFKILQLLTKRPGWVYNRSQILDYLWGNDKIVIDRTVDVHIKNLRDKIGRFASHITNIRGVGYKFERPSL